MTTSLETALVRWSVVCHQWHEVAPGCGPQLGPFLAGWFLRDMGASKPADPGEFGDSFRAGWREADDEIVIASRRSTPNGS